MSGFRLQDLAWLGVLALALGLLIGGSLWRLRAATTRTQALHAEVQEKLRALRARAGAATAEAGLAQDQAQLAAWASMTSSQARRIAALTSAARAADVSLVSLRTRETEAAQDGRIVTASHSLDGTGSIRQLTRFLEELQAAPGLVAVEELELEPAIEGEPDRLHASILVTWFAAATSPASAGDSMGDSVR